MTRTSSTRTGVSRPPWHLALWGAALLGAACGPAAWKPGARVESAVSRSALANLEIMEGSLVRARQREVSGIDLSRQIYRYSSGNVTSVQRIGSYLESVGSPMAPFAAQIIESSNRYGVDPKLIVAIAGVESTYGRNCRGFNAWGWNNGRTRWKSWSASIEGFTRVFSDNYPHHLSPRRFARTYNPNTPDAWGRKVVMLMASIENFPVQSAEVDVTEPA